MNNWIASKNQTFSQKYWNSTLDAFCSIVNVCFSVLLASLIPIGFCPLLLNSRWSGYAFKVSKITPKNKLTLLTLITYLVFLHEIVSPKSKKAWKAIAHQDKSWLLLNVKREFSEFKASHIWLWLKKRGKVNLLNVFIFYTPIFQQINRTVANSYATMLHFVKCVRSVITKASFITKYK